MTRLVDRFAGRLAIIFWIVSARNDRLYLKPTQIYTIPKLMNNDDNGKRIFLKVNTFQRLMMKIRDRYSLSPGLVRTFTGLCGVEGIFLFRPRRWRRCFFDQRFFRGDGVHLGIGSPAQSNTCTWRSARDVKPSRPHLVQATRVMEEARS